MLVLLSKPLFFIYSVYLTGKKVCVIVDLLSLRDVIVLFKHEYGNFRYYYNHSASAKFNRF